LHYYCLFLVLLYKQLFRFDPAASKDEKEIRLNEIIGLIKGNLEVADKMNGNVALHIASQNGHFEVVDLLISRGAKLSPKNRGGNTPLHMATEYGFDNVVILLRNKGADPLAKNDEGCSAETGIEGKKDVVKADDTRDAE